MDSIPTDSQQPTTGASELPSKISEDFNNDLITQYSAQQQPSRGYR